MKHIKKITAMVTALAAASALFAQTVQVGPRTHVQDDLAMPTNGMLFGVVVDTNQDGFNPCLLMNAMSPIQITAGSVVQVYDTYGAPTDEMIYVDTINNLTVTGGTGGPPTWTDGFANRIANLPTDTNPLANGISENDQFGLIWFPSLGDPGGMLVNGDPFGWATDAALIIPAAGSAVDFDGILADPLDWATYGGSIVPEPSAYALMGVGLLMGLVFLRRRK